MKQTAIEWLYEELILEGINVPKVFYDKAKEMEKEQMIEYHNFIVKKFLYLEYTYNTSSKIIVEHYYNETFKQDESNT